MKKLFGFTIIACFWAATTFGQDNFTKYCQVTVGGIFLSTNLKAKVSFGKNTTKSDDSLSSSGKSIAKFFDSEPFKSNVDILNYMSSMGWNLVTAYAIASISKRTSSAEDYIFFFKKNI